MTMAKDLPMMQRGSPEAAGRYVEEFRFVTRDSFNYLHRFVYGFRVIWNSNSNRVWS